MRSGIKGGFGEGWPGLLDRAVRGRLSDLRSTGVPKPLAAGVANGLRVLRLSLPDSLDESAEGRGVGTSLWTSGNCTVSLRDWNPLRNDSVAATMASAALCIASVASRRSDTIAGLLGRTDLDRCPSIALSSTAFWQKCRAPGSARGKTTTGKRERRSYIIRTLFRFRRKYPARLDRRG